MNLFERHAHLNQLFQQTPVDAAYLSGSLATRAAFGEMVDVDIAILLADQIAADQFLDYQLYFFSELSKRLESDALDVFILNQASLLLKLQVIKYGQILYSRDEKKRTAFEARAVVDYLDFRQMDEVQNRALARRLRAPSLGLDREGIRAALKRLTNAQVTLERTLAGAATAESLADDEAQRAVIERALLLGVEALAHSATLIYAGLGVSQPEAYQDVLAQLGKRDIVPIGVIARLEMLVKQRDTLLRTPEVIASPALYEIARQSATDFAAFAGAIRTFLGEESN